MNRSQSNKRLRRLIVWAVVIAVVIGAGMLAALPKPVFVDTAPVTRGTLTVTLDHEGKTRVRHRFVVSAPVAGRVLRIDLRPGDRVVAHDTVLATLLPGAPTLLDARSRAEAQSRVKAADAMLEQAKAQRDQAKAQSDFANTERDRARGLFTSGLVTAEARQTAETDALARQQALQAAEAAVQAATQNAATARAALLDAAHAGAAPDEGGRSVITLRSPISGVVLNRDHESEAVVPQGEPLIEVADTSALEVAADFLSTDAVQIKPSMRAVIDQWGGSAPLQATVDRIEPGGFVKVSALGVEEQRVWVVMNFDDPHAAWQALGDAYRVEARVVVWQRADAVMVPTSSLFRRGEDWAVFVDASGVARLRTVHVGHRSASSAEILAGLAPGDRVVVYPPDTLSDGTRISPRNN